jgi:hypothetical protein
VNRSRAPVSKTMAGLAPYLAADQLDEALAVVLDDKLDRSRAAQVAAVAEHLDPARRAAVVEATLTMEARLRADILTRLLPHLDGAARDGALAHARAAAAEAAPHNRLLWMIRLCGHVPDPAWRAETLAMIAAEPDQSQRGDSLVTLVQSLDSPHLDGQHLDEALDMVLALTDDNTRASALTQIAAHLSGDALQRACDDLFALPAGDRRASALVGLLRAWPEATSGGRSAATVALADALAVNDARSRSTLLTEVAEFLDHDDLGRALAAADALPGNSGRGETLGEVARHLDDARLAQAFAAIVTLTPAPMRDRPLQMLARRAPAGLLHEIVAAARAEWGRATLVAVARRAAELAGDSQAEAAGLTALRTALDGDDRGTALEILTELIGFVADAAGPDAMHRLWPHVAGTLDRWP